MANKRNILIMGTMTELIIRSGWTDINYLDYVFFIPFRIKKKWKSSFRLSFEGFERRFEAFECPFKAFGCTYKALCEYTR